LPSLGIFEVIVWHHGSKTPLPSAPHTSSTKQNIQDKILALGQFKMRCHKKSHLHWFQIGLESQQPAPILTFLKEFQSSDTNVM